MSRQILTASLLIGSPTACYFGLDPALFKSRYPDRSRSRQYDSTKVPNVAIVKSGRMPSTQEGSHCGNGAGGVFACRYLE